MGILTNLIKLVAPKRKAKAGGSSYTSTFDPSSRDGILTVPTYRDHLVDIFNSRQVDDSRELLKQLFKHDPDVSAALNGYLTMANTPMVVLARDLEGNIDREATHYLRLVLSMITSQTDYSAGFQLKRSLRGICEDLRWMALLRGAVGAELVFDKAGNPVDLRIVDMATIEWEEKSPGVYKPFQVIPNSDEKVSLDIPNFFVSFYRKDPTGIYGESSFVAAINTIAARQQVINDLYRIMQITGFPRISIKVVEEVLVKNAPANVKNDPAKLKAWVDTRMREVADKFASIRADQPFVHSDSVQPSIMNDKKPGSALDISAVIETLNAQNQAGLKTMSTIIGRGSQGVNTSSVEARIAAMNADELNEPLADLFEKTLSFALHMNGFQGFAEVYFEKAELRPDLELEPQRVMRQSRLHKDLSLGLITDDEYHLWVYGRLRPQNAPELMGTGFMGPNDGVTVDEKDVTPNSDPLGRSLVPEGGTKQARSNEVK